MTPSPKLASWSSKYLPDAVVALSHYRVAASSDAPPLQACCKAGSPQAAVHALEEAEKYGLHEESVVSAHRFNYLLSQLYKAGDEDCEFIISRC